MYYFPFSNYLGLFVVVSWVSFLVPPEVVPGRMAMLITLFLVLINIFNSGMYLFLKVWTKVTNIHSEYVLAVISMPIKDLFRAYLISKTVTTYPSVV